jgi:hypothetical protein
MSKLLLDESPLLVFPSLAQKIGLNESIVLQQIHYWIMASNHNINGENWIYATYEQLQNQFTWWSIKTIQRTLTNLKDAGLLKVNNFNKKKYDKTNWYAIDYEKFNNLEIKNEVDVHMDRSNCPVDEDKMASSRSGQNDQTNTIDKTTTENNIYTTGHQDKNIPIQEIIDRYNSTCKSRPKIKMRTNSRDKTITARWKKFNSIDTYQTLFEKAEASDFLSGRNGKWTRCNFDWLINETNMAKVLEGNYDNDQSVSNGDSNTEGINEEEIRKQEKLKKEHELDNLMDYYMGNQRGDTPDV